MRAFVVGLACGVLSLAVPAQTVSPSAPASAASAAAAMARARRMAEGPMRAILEAGKVRRRVEGDGEAGGDAAARLPQPRRAGAAEDADSAPAARAVPQAAVAAAAAAPPPNAGEVIATLPAEVPRVRPASATPPVARPTTLPPSTTLPAATQMPPLLPPLAPATPPAPPATDAQPPRPSATRPNLVMLVEPDIPAPILRTMASREVMVELSLRADGTVAGVHLLPPAPVELAPYLVEALRQWRYDPLPGPRRHRVELVLDVVR